MPDSTERDPSIVRDEKLSPAPDGLALRDQLANAYRDVMTRFLARDRAINGQPEARNGELIADSASGNESPPTYHEGDEEGVTGTSRFFYEHAAKAGAEVLSWNTMRYPKP